MEEVRQARAKVAIHQVREVEVIQAAGLVQGAVEVVACFRL